MRTVQIHEITDGNIEPCRDLCNELMAFQQSMALMKPEIFDGMNFDTRMKISYQNAATAHVALATDDGLPIGYVFSTIETVSDELRSAVPAWMPQHPGEKWQGFYPEGVTLPSRCGCLNNLYLREAYKGRGLGRRLLDISMEWMQQQGMSKVFVYISNGNVQALNFYEKHGFIYSHDVFGGFITAAVYTFPADVGNEPRL